MKKTLGGMLIGMLALVGTAMGAVYTDDATNYPEPPGWVDGTNGGDGFEAWHIVANGGDGGWAGCGIWDSGGAGLGMGMAFGYVGKVGFVNIDRDFSQALNIGDSFALDFGVNWDSDGGNKGFSLFANGVEVVNVNHGGFPGEITMNGAPALTSYGTGTMRWTFTQEAADQIAVDATGRDGVETFSATVTVANGYGYLGAVRFYSSGLASNAPDERQSYFDNLTLDQEGTPPPGPLTLTFIDGTWDPDLPGPYEYTLQRQGAVADDIVITSSNPDAVVAPPGGATFEAGSNQVTFIATVMSLTNGPATLIASNEASGAWAEYVVTPVPPSLAIAGPYEILVAGPVQYTLTRAGLVGNSIVLTSSDPTVLSVDPGATFADGVDETTFNAIAIQPGSTILTASNAASGAWTTYNVTVLAPTLTLIGPVEVWVGGSRTYTVARSGAVGPTVNLASSDANVMTVPATVDFPEGENTVTFQAEALAVGTTILSAQNDDAAAAPLTVNVTEAPEFAAYDDASLYAGGVWELSPAHVSGFSDWTETLSAEMPDSFRGRFIGEAAIAPINQDGAAFGLYANYDGDAPSPLPEVKVSREFPAGMVRGQTFSVDVAYNFSSGTKGFKLKGEFEGTAYDRFELFNSGNDTWSYKLDGDDETITVIWDGYIEGGFMGRVQAICTAPNTFTFSFLRGAEETPTLVEDVVLPGTIDQVEFYNFNGGSGVSENFYFNRMWLTEGLPPDPRLEITGPWDITATGLYEYTLTRLGAVSDTVHLSSDNEAAVTVPETVTFGAGEETVTFMATVGSLTNGEAVLRAEDPLGTAWSEFTVRPREVGPGVEELVFDPLTGDLSFNLPAGYSLEGLFGADFDLDENGDWDWVELELGTDYTVDGEGRITILTENYSRMILRVMLVND